MKKGMDSTMNANEANALETAIQIATQSHRGQRDKAGHPYILHLLRVMQAVSGSDAQQAGILHDCVEDTATSLEDLRAMGVSSKALEAIELLTHGPEVSYAEYVCRLKSNDIAKRVKLADLNDNYRLDRVAYRAAHAQEDARRIQKYILTSQYLVDQIEESEYRSRMHELER